MQHEGVRLHTPERTIGTLDLYDSRPHHFSTDDLAVAHVLARHTAIALTRVQDVQNFSIAIDSRKLIGQAQGILMERYDLDPDRAFEVLRRYSQDANVKLRIVAQTIVENRRSDFGALMERGASGYWNDSLSSVARDVAR